jgi:hypothetical protein
VNFDRYNPFGTTYLPEGVEFELLDPYGFTIKLDASSEIQLFRDEYLLQFDGVAQFPTKVKDATGSRPEVAFKRADQLFYIQQEYQFANPLAIIDNMDMTLNTAEYILDLSEEKSPNKVEGDDWKGVYFTKASVKIPADFDQTNQLVLDQDYTFDYIQNDSEMLDTWIDAQGMTFVWEHDFDGAEIAKFNTFPMQLNEAKITLQGHALSESQFMGDILVPLINQSEPYTIKIPISEDGFGVGFFDGGLDEKFTFNEDGGENKTEVTIKQATFKDNERLEMSVDLDVPALGFDKPLAISSFMVYGDHFIGLGKRNGAVDVDKINGMYNGFAFELNQLSASLQDEHYVFSYLGNMKLSPEFSDPDGGEPEITFHCKDPVSRNIAEAVNGIDHPADIPFALAEIASQDPRQIKLDFEFQFKHESLEIKAKLKRIKDDPVWGTRLKGEAAGYLLKPVKSEFGGTVVFGSKDGTPYFYIEAYRVDHTKIGVRVVKGVKKIGDINMVGFEGKIYHKMNAVDGKLVLDNDVEYGAALYAQLLDKKTQGGLLMMDAAIEVENTNSNLSMAGLSLLDSHQFFPVFIIERCFVSFVDV